jgi:hypothetical protein
MEDTANNSVGGNISGPKLSNGAAAGRIYDDLVFFSHTLDGRRNNGFELV